MATGENAPRETLKAKNEAPRHSTTPDRPATEEDRYEQQLEGKLDILKNALLDLGQTYPALKVEDLYEQCTRMAYDGDLAFQDIEEMTDHLSTYVLSDQGVARVNGLIQQGKTGEIIDTLKLNLAAYDTISLLDIPDWPFQSIYQEIQDFKKVIIFTQGKGKEYKGAVIYPLKTGEIWAKFIFGDKEATQSQSPETHLPEQPVVSPEVEEEPNMNIDRIDIEDLPPEEREAIVGHFAMYKENILGKSNGEEDEEPGNDKPKEESENGPLDSSVVEKTSSLKTKDDLEEPIPDEESEQ